MNYLLLVTAAFNFISTVVQLLVVLSAPVTGKEIGYNLSLAKYNGLAFGVFGACNYQTNQCSAPGIGYTYADDPSGVNEEAGIQLPTNARNSISKLLVVHVVAFALSSVLTLVSVFFVCVVWIRELQIRRLIHSSEDDSGDTEDVILDTQSTSTIKNLDSQSSSSKTLPRKIDLTPFLNFLLIFSLLSCLFTLLGLLSDIILFVPYLSALGWAQVIPISLLAMETTLVCFMKRSILSRRHLEGEYYYANDDMRTRQHTEVIEDDGSDDGFYVYTNGFYSNYGDREEHNQSQQSNTNSWRRHTPFNDTDDNISINSSQINRERIQLRDLNFRTTPNND